MFANRETLAWRKSTASNVGACVEVAPTVNGVAVRNTRNPQGDMLEFTRPEWDAFLSGVHGGEFSLDVMNQGPG